jgi:hypothetical protein
MTGQPGQGSGLGVGVGEGKGIGEAIATKGNAPERNRKNVEGCILLLMANWRIESSFQDGAKDSVLLLVDLPMSRSRALNMTLSEFLEVG